MSSAEFPAASMIPAHLSNYYPSDRRPADIQHIVIHLTYGQPLAARAARRIQTEGLGSSFHFVIGQAGEIVQAVLVKDIAYHAHAANRSSVGIEHCARPPGSLGKTDLGLPLTDLQLVASARLVAWLLARCHLPANRTVIQGHSEIDKKTSHTGCPNSLWPWERYMALVDAEYASLAL